MSRNPIGLAPFFIVAYVLLSTSLFHGMPEKTMAFPLYPMENEEGAYTTEIFRVPLFIKDVRVDVSVKMNSYLKVWIEFRIGKQLLAFNLNDMSLSYHIEQDRVQVEGKISEQAMSVKAKIDTDGIIEGCPQIVLSFYSL